MRGRVVRFRPFGMCPVLVLDVSHVAATPPSLRDDFFNFWQIGRLEMKALQLSAGVRDRRKDGSIHVSAHTPFFSLIHARIHVLHVQP